MVDLLIKYRADVNSRSDAGHTPYDEAMYWSVKKPDAETGQCSREYKETINLLQEHGGLPNDVRSYEKLARSRARLDEKAKRKSASSSSADSGWRRVFDKTSGSMYYANINTGESQWDEPHSLAQQLLSSIAADNPHLALLSLERAAGGTCKSGVPVDLDQYIAAERCAECRGKK